MSAPRRHGIPRLGFGLGLGLLLGVGVIACKGDKTPVDKSGAAESAPTPEANAKCNLDELEQADAALRHASPDQRPTLAAYGLSEACPPDALPASYLKFFASAKSPNGLDAALLGAPDPERLGFEASACPDAAELGKELKASPLTQRRSLIWNRCGLADGGVVVAPAELSPRATLMPFAVAAALREQGLDPKLANRYGRLLVAVEREVLGATQPMPGQTLPKVAAAPTALGLSPQVFVNREGVFFLDEGFDFPSNTQAESPGIPGIPALTLRLRGHAKLIDAQEPPPVSLVVDAHVPMSRVRRVAGSLHNAGYAQWSGAVEVPNGSGELPFARAPHPSAPPAELMTVVLRVHAGGYGLRSADPATRPWPAAASVRELPLLEVSGAKVHDAESLAAALGAVQDAAPEGKIRVSLESDDAVSFGVVASAMATVRALVCPRPDALACERLVLPAGGGLAGAKGQAVSGAALDAKSSPALRGPHVVSRKPIVIGTLEMNVVRREIRRQRPALERCYREGLTRSPSLAGSVKFELVVGGQGRVQAAKAVGRGFSDANTTRCITKEMLRWKFSAPHLDGVARVTLPLELRPGDKASDPDE